MTKLAVPITARDIAEAATQIAQATLAGAEILELRLDYLAEPGATLIAKLVSMVQDHSFEIIATCRPDWEGGKFGGSDNERFGFLKTAAQAGADWIDMELVSLTKHPQALVDILGVPPASLIISSHNFEGMPDDLDQRLLDIAEKVPGIAKIAYLAPSIHECFTALDILNAYVRQGQNIIALAMGAEGVISRLLAKKLGAYLTFAALEEGAATAPGQTTISELKQVYRWDFVTPETKLLGIIGHPVSHSLSPHVHNAAFTDAGYDGLYLPLLVPPTGEDFARFMDAMRSRPWLHARGFSVTIPHKQHALKYIKNHGGVLEPLAERIGAVNTIILEEDNHLVGYNTDYAGALEALTDALNCKRSDLKGMTAAVLGAGGAARAIIAGLTDAGVEVTIYNRTAARAEALAEELYCHSDALENLGHSQHDILLNCTSIGMHPDSHASPVPTDYLKPGMIVFDTVYNPLATLLLQRAVEAGAKTIDGASMFVNQAAAQFELFTGKKAPRHLMRQVVETRLSQP